MFVEPDPSPSSPSETPASSSFPAPNNEASFKSHPGSSQELGDHHVLALHWNTLSNTSAGDWGACDCLVRVGVQVPSHLCWQGGRWGHSFLWCRLLQNDYYQKYFIWSTLDLTLKTFLGLLFLGALFGFCFVLLLIGISWLLTSSVFSLRYMKEK